MTDETADVAVVGGGLSGLVAARRCRRAGAHLDHPAARAAFESLVRAVLCADPHEVSLAFLDSFAAGSSTRSGGGGGWRAFDRRHRPCRRSQIPSTAFGFS